MLINQIQENNVFRQDNVFSFPEWTLYYIFYIWSRNYNDSKSTYYSLNGSKLAYEILSQNTVVKRDKPWGCCLSLNLSLVGFVLFNI